MPGIHAAARAPMAERGLGPFMPDTLSMSFHSPSFTPLLQNDSCPGDAVPLLLSSLCEMAFSWAESQAWMPRGRDNIS